MLRSLSVVTHCAVISPLTSSASVQMALAVSLPVTSKASEVYNIMVHPFSLTRFKGVLFLGSKTMCEADEGANYGAELSALANSWKGKFGGEDPHFFYTIPNRTLASKITTPESISGKATGYEIGRWWSADAESNKQALELIERMLGEVYR